MAQPINITFDDTPMPLQLISNLAETPFELDGCRYASIEAFWQGLKFANLAKRAELAHLTGHAAKSAGDKAPKASVIVYQGAYIKTGSPAHWLLMERACRAKFLQCEAARSALLATGQTPLKHKVKVDSRTIPGVVMAEIWMRIRAELPT